MAEIIRYADHFQDQLNGFIKTLQEFIGEYYVANCGVGVKPPKIVAEMGSKWVKIVREKSFDNRDVHCFIAPDGQIYRAANWAKPAKHPRGSIFDPNYGVGTAVDVHGAISLK